MQYDNVAQGMRCEKLKEEIRVEMVQLRTREDHVTRLDEKLDLENRQLDNLRSQANRTGDHQGFTPDIQDAEDKINNLQRQLNDAKREASQQREHISQLQRAMAQEGCRGFA